ncbi:protein ABIL2 isoform X2 [Daucus carota subsp. sativus]|uniref:protein ABIL2 isoform X2 n=1 Tax=Daucus carota subsp. sativus TaxID=79200 RepID=UPI0007EF79D6|nr:PREDICTED: protein ABIL2 isoform X1 [Daucus carota subsp. sativus]XP_017235793.1 PREDICTED: protein ABIL2 isoform X1 [Daucus carota subsp. sativus]XP_017235794.1 PREDICTED: protein ABIL2 isoform X1 [Daucus carota subsp. sativus]XP_017235795.1 PREDICTED: protein ABIL2 isoform X1 [Daucus carota subsp. sativus]
MERGTSLFSANVAQQSSNYDELFMQQHILFTDSLKDLKNIRKQLYSAAEYFESSYERDDDKQLVVETVKDYATKALISSVDHLGSVAFKVTTFLDDKVTEFSDTKVRFSNIEQRLRICQEFTEQVGVRRQTLVVETPKHHKRYIFPAKPTSDSNGEPELIKNSPGLSLDEGSNKSVQPNLVRPDAQIIRGISRPLSASPGSANFSFTRAASRKVSDTRGVSPLRFSLKRAESVADRSRSPNPANNNIQQHFPVPQRSSSMLIHTEDKGTSKAIVQYRKSKSLFKTLLRYTSPRRVRN